jgi:hypothetical protein
LENLSHLIFIQFTLMPSESTLLYLSVDLVTSLKP